MHERKKDILAQLQKKILPFQGYKLSTPGQGLNIELGPIMDSFPGSCFPFGAIHEFISSETEALAATTGFIAGLLSSFMRRGRVCVWISTSRKVFPPALKNFDIDPHHMLFVDLKKEKDALWVMEETLKCDGIAAVIGEIKEINFTESRRLQLAVEQSGVTGFVLRHSPKKLNTIACVSRWKITPLPSEFNDDMPGLGFPSWNVELLKIRNGRPGSWRMEWSAGRFHHISSSFSTSIIQQQKRKTG